MIIKCLFLRPWHYLIVVHKKIALRRQALSKEINVLNESLEMLVCHLLLVKKIFNANIIFLLSKKDINFSIWVLLKLGRFKNVTCIFVHHQNVATLLQQAKSTENKFFFLSKDLYTKYNYLLRNNGLLSKFMAI